MFHAKNPLQTVSTPVCDFDSYTQGALKIREWKMQELKHMESHSYRNF